MKIIIPVLLLFPLTFGLVRADPINFIAITTDITVYENVLRYRINIPHVPVFPAEDYAGRIKYLTEHLNSNLKLSNSGGICPVSVIKLIVGETDMTLEGDFTCTTPVIRTEELRIESHIFSETFLDVNHFIKIHIGEEEKAILLTVKEPVFPIIRHMGGGDSQDISIWSILKQFIGLGIPHIIFGFDHVLFVLAVHSIVRKFKDIVIVVTAFTVAHSLTLILAGLGWITLTGRIVEPLIAFSIAYTAIRNIFIERGGRGEESVLKERWMSTFSFGLVHGLGFAGALAEIKIPSAYFIPALLSFNIGVELGQFMIIAVFIPVLILIRKLGRLKETVYVLSATIALVSVFWTLQRIFI